MSATVTPAAGFTQVVAVSAAMKALLEDVRRLLDSDRPVLIQGESGTGKDLIAHLLHYQGPRREAPFIRIDCPSIPAELLESELFGYEKGAFTDAHRAKVGKLELAAGGTLLFDQIHELSQALQAKLLRVVEERRFERLGGTRTLSVDARILASSSVDLKRQAGAGLFREDLYHRLSVLPLALPPLRSRREDILPLAEFFLAREREPAASASRSFSPEANEVLLGYYWPGNVRELRSAVERASLVCVDATLPASALPAALRESPRSFWEGRSRKPALKDVEQAYIRYVLEQAAGNQTRAAQVLGISRKSLWEKRRRYGIP